MSEMDRLSHVCMVQEEIVNLQKEIIDDLFLLLLQHISAEADEIKGIVEKINEAAVKNSEL